MSHPIANIAFEAALLLALAALLGTAWSNRRRILAALRGHDKPD